MTDTLKRPLVTRTGLITASIAVIFPLLADRYILSAMSEVRDLGMGAVIGMGFYTAAAFLLLDSAMRPRRRVRVALWMGLALTAIVWVAFARTGQNFQAFISESNVFYQSCNENAKDMLTAIVSGTAAERSALSPVLEKCVAAYDKPGSAHVGTYMLTMLWPPFIFCIMGGFAKIGEAISGDPNHAA